MLDDVNVLAYNNRAYTYYELGDYSNAMKDYNSAIKIEPSNADLFYGRSELFLNIKKDQKALSDAQIAVELNPGSNKYQEWYRKLKEKLSTD
jgi:tetratricopeptide (TPR) repeat protein